MARLAVEYSGGKDSRAVLDLAVRAGLGVEAVLYTYVPDLECERASVAWAESRGAKVHQLPHPDLAQRLAEGAYRPHVRGWEGLGNYDWTRARTAARARTGCDWIASGITQFDSFRRRGMLSRIGGGGFDRALRVVYPLHNWTPSQVRRYLRERRVPPPPKLGHGGRRIMGGLSFDARALRDLARDWPADFTRLEQVFPWLRAALLRPEPRTDAGDP